MRNPNGYGTVVKLKGNRHRPYMVRSGAKGYKNGCPLFDIIGYAKTREEGMMMLAEYNRSPWNVDAAKITVGELWELWLEQCADEYSATTVRSARSRYKTYIAQYSGMKYRDIRSAHIKNSMRAAKSASMKNNIRTVWANLDKLALELDVISKSYVQTVPSVPIEQSDRKPFTDDEITVLWEHTDDEVIQVVLILIYSGWRINEFLRLKKSNVDLEAGTMQGGGKTRAGTNRIVPIHPKIEPFVRDLMQTDGGLLYGKRQYNRMIAQIKKHLGELGMDHIPHECRHTCETLLDKAGADRKCIDMIMGHAGNGTGQKVYNHRTMEELQAAIRLI